MKTCILAIAVTFIFLSLPQICLGESPLEVLQESISQAIHILKDPRYHGKGAQAQQQRLKELLYQVFDFHEFSRHVLAQHWQDFSPSQRHTFVRLFSEFLSNFYLSRLQERYQDEKVRFVDQTMLTPSRAVIRAKVISKSIQLPVEIWMTKEDGRWKSYNVSAMGISAVLYYRAQIRALLLGVSPDELMERLKGRIRQQQ
jgi:ABC-type transporter MlaC component